MHENTPLASEKPAMAGKSELRSRTARSPASRPGDGLADPTMVGSHALDEGLESISAQRTIDQEVMQDQIVQGQDAGALEGQFLHRFVMVVIAHLVERQSAVLPELFYRNGPPSRLQFLRDGLPR